VSRLRRTAHNTFTHDDARVSKKRKLGGEANDTDDALRHARILRLEEVV